MAENAEKIDICGVQREKGFLYFLKGNAVMRTLMARGRSKDSPKPAHELVHQGAFERDDKQFIYFLDKDGDIAKAPRKNASKGD